jgi:methionine synthase II (cobalamin-independent)
MGGRRAAGRSARKYELAAGIVDVKDPRVQSAQEVCQLAEQLMRLVPPDRLLLCPSRGLGRRTV